MRLFLFLFFIISISLVAQKSATNEPVTHHFIDLRKTSSSFKVVYIGTADTSTVKNYLLNSVPNLKNTNSNLQLNKIVESLTGTHLLFTQLYNGVQVYRGSVKVNMDKQGNITSLFDNTFSFRDFNPENNFPNPVLTATHFNNIRSANNCYFFTAENKCVAARRINYLTIVQKDMEVIVDPNGNVLYSADQNVYFKPATTDSLVSAMVFLPDPLTTAGVSYGGSYVDAVDGDLPTLNNERVSVNMRVNYSDDTFRLQNAYVMIADFSAPTVAPVFSVSTPAFNYTRSQAGFENVNAYYHINVQQQHLRSLGFTNIVNYPIWVDTRGDLADNSYFAPGHSPPRLTFGIGGVDDAEDADVIIHEYGHAMSHSAAPSTNTGVERTTLDEANGDYFAASYSRDLDPFNWQNVYSWDGHNPYWPGRVVVSTKHYPEDLVHNLYTDADIWSSTVMQMCTEIGRAEADAILMESIYGYAANMTMEDAASLYMLADAALFAGKNANSICTNFFNRGLFANCQIDPNDGKTIHLFNSKGFYDGTGAIIRFKEEVAYVKFTMYTILGQLVSVVEKQNINSYFLKAEILPKGIYVLKVETAAETACFELIND